MAAEFDYKSHYIDWCLDMDDLFEHMVHYRNDNPPVGMMLKAIFGTEKKQEDQSNESLKDDLAAFYGNGLKVQKRPKAGG
jgi:hypothetical protein